MIIRLRMPLLLSVRQQPEAEPSVPDPVLSAMGATSPLGVFGSGGSSGTGIPFAATEINPGGLSPAPNPNCSMRPSNSPAMSASGTTGVTTGAASTFDGDGLAASSLLSLQCSVREAWHNSGRRQRVCQRRSKASRATKDPRHLPVTNTCSRFLRSRMTGQLGGEPCEGALPLRAKGEHLNSTCWSTPLRTS